VGGNGLRYLRVHFCHTVNLLKLVGSFVPVNVVSIFSVLLIGILSYRLFI
jgi:hypothetical protein